MMDSTLQAVGSVNATATIATTVLHGCYTDATRMLHGCYVTHGSVRATLRRKEAVKPALCIMVLVYERYWATLSTWIYRALPVFPDVCSIRVSYHSSISRHKILIHAMLVPQNTMKPPFHPKKRYSNLWITIIAPEMPKGCLRCWRESQWAVRILIRPSVFAMVK